MKEEINSRIESVKQRFSDLDIEGKIAAHPLPAVGIALAIGAAIGLLKGLGGGGKKVDKEVAAKSTIGGAISGAITALAMRMVKDYALGHLSGYAKSYLGGQQDPVASKREQGASRDASVERFLEH